MAEGGGDSLNSFNITSDLLNMITDNEAGFLPDFSIGESSLTGVGPYLEILEQPKQRGFRFRYSCEGPSHGGLPGERSEKGRKSFPSVQINGYAGPARIEVSLVTASDPPKPHAHSLVGKNVVDGVCVIEIGQEQGMTACFPNLGVQHVTKKNVKTVLFERYMKSHKLHTATLMANGSTDQALDMTQFGGASGSGHQGVFDKNIVKTVANEEAKKIEKLVEEESKNMNLSTVRLCFQTYLPDQQGRFVKCLHPVYSNQIYDSKAAAASELKICRMDRQAGFVNGGEEVFLLCDKVQKEDIEVRFFENMDGKDWEDFGKFSPTDVHRQYAIVFKTPAYWNVAIEKPVVVSVELRRKSDKETSNTMEFTYKPTEFDPEQIGAKRRKKVPHFGDYSDQGGSSGLGGAGAGGGGGGVGGGGGGGIGLNLDLWNQLFSFLPPGPSGSGGMTHQSQGQAPPQDAATPGGSAEDRGSSEKETKVASMEMCVAVSKALRQTFVSAVSLEHFSRTNDLRHILAGQHSQSTTPNDDGDCALHIAIINGHSNIVNDMLAVLSPRFVNQFNHLRQTPLHLAVITKQPNVIAKLLQAGADVTLQDRHGNTPLHLASQQSSPTCLHSLVTRPSHGVFSLRYQKYPELDMPNYNGLTAVHLAVISDQLENLKILHSIKANMNAQDGKSSFSPLHHAVEANNLIIAGYLILTADVDIDIPTIDGNTPLHLSSGHGWESITALLVAANADVNAVNTEDERAVDLATTTEVMKILEYHDGTSRVTSVETRMEFPSMDDETCSESMNDNLDMLSATERCEFVSSLCKDWKLLAERLNLNSYVSALKLQKNPAKHLLDIYETVDGSAQNLRDALVDLGNQNAVEIIENSLASMDSFPALRKDSQLAHFSETDSDYGSLPIADESLSPFQSLRYNKMGPHSPLNPSRLSAEQKN